MDLYFDPRTVNCRKVLAGMDLVGAEYVTKNIDYFAEGHKSDAFRAVNPNAALPAMVDGDLVLWESNSILQYAADKTRAFDVYPNDFKARADIARWHLWEASAWFPSCYVYLVENVVKPILGAEPDPAILEAQNPKFQTLATILEDRLKDRDYIMGDAVTIADIAVAAPMHLHSYQKLPLDSNPNIKAWIARMESDVPSWKKTDVAPLLGLT